LSTYKSYLPRERAQKVGVKMLADYELLALLLGTGSKNRDVLECAKAVLQQFGTVQEIGKASMQQLEKIQGIGMSKAISILAAIELGRRTYKTRDQNVVSITSPRDCVAFFEKDFSFHYQECFMCLFLNTKNQVIIHKEIYRGGLHTINVHPREIFRSAIEVSAAALILIHNHPSGDPNPSAADIQTTKNLLVAADTIGIPILDHVIIGEGEFVSLKEKGYAEF